MSEARYDAIVIGGRCAGSPTAMLLARQGHRVLLVDKATFPSDTMSTHLVHPPGVAALHRWGLLERLEATGCPPVEKYSFDFGPITIAGTPRPIDGIARAYGPRRTILDKLLIDAAAEAGAEVREAFTVEEILGADGKVDGIRGHGKGGKSISARAEVVIGADGRHSRVAKAVEPEQYNQRPSRLAMYYAYWSGLPVGGFETTIRAENRRGWAALPTHDDLTCVPFGWPREEFQANRKDIEGNFLKAVALAPEFAELVRGAKRESKFIGSAELPGYFRKPFGPGWALVGDAGYHKNPITAMGINDAFRDAELLSTGLHQALAGERDYEEAMGAYQRARDEEAIPVYEFTDEFATMEPPPQEMQQLLGAIHGDQDEMDAFISVQASTMPAPEFFAPANVGRIMSGAAAAG
ncbi:MAG TPA: NAD(P)/FAD-dependent oxidoreductase [Solirubrobacterales bacterium]|nr:NAD(P)/FAD-dependent oxidoreductase [Solirubrobacterales bacterium]